MNGGKRPQWRYAYPSGDGDGSPSAVFSSTSAGITRAITWIRRGSNGRILAAVEGTSSYGAQLTAALTNVGIPVAEVQPPSRASQAVNGKSDVIDAEAAARSVLGQDESRVATPRATGDRTALRILLAARKLMDQQRTASRNALTALLCTIDRPCSDGRNENTSWRHRRPIDRKASDDAAAHAERPLSMTPIGNTLAFVPRHALELSRRRLPEVADGVGEFRRELPPPRRQSQSQPLRRSPQPLCRRGSTAQDIVATVRKVNAVPMRWALDDQASCPRGLRSPVGLRFGELGNSGTVRQLSWHRPGRSTR